MKPEIKKLMFDIVDSATIIQEYLASVADLASYRADQKTIDAVERRLAMIGEALWKANKMDQTIVVTGKPKIIALRHILVHDYDLVEDETVWVICKKHLPVLKREAEMILGLTTND